MFLSKVMGRLRVNIRQDVRAGFILINIWSGQLLLGLCVLLLTHEETVSLPPHSLLCFQHFADLERRFRVGEVCQLLPPRTPSSARPRETTPPPPPSPSAAAATACSPPRCLRSAISDVTPPPPSPKAAFSQAGPAKQLIQGESHRAYWRT